ncbi:MAG: branched-chain amino acid ABC transporter permease [Chloroflexi bacterium]|nr:branched-chain amino acid ABC transporter permease [Chloroflexota bacterium]
MAAKPLTQGNQPTSVVGQMIGRWNALPVTARFLVLLAAFAAIHLLTSNDYVIRIAGNVCLFAALAVALNVVVGYAGLLDLGFIAFYGIGAYAYAILSSDQFGIHWPTWVSLPVIGLLGIVFGLLLGSPSLRLLGDYLAIVTLGFGVVFAQLALTLDRVEVPWYDGSINVTGGTNGIVKLDPLGLFGFQLSSVTHYFYALLIWLAIVLIIVHRLNQSHLGRGWRSMGEDALAAETMGMPTRRLKLFAFSCGAAIAGISGGIFAAWQRSVFPQNFSTDILITLYAMMVLGGISNLGGAVLGAVVLAVTPELLRSPELSRLLFYATLVLGLLLLMKPRRNGLIVLVSVIVLGFVVRWIAGATIPDLLSSPTIEVAAESISTGLDRASQQFGIYVQQWILLLKEPLLPGNVAFAVSIPALLGLSRMKPGNLRLILTIPAIYLLVFVWETRLAAEPAVTRLLLIGGLLVVLMIFRPNGLLGKRKVEIV